MSQTTNNQAPRTVAIIGGGLAGLSAGSALAEAGYHVELFERRPYLGGRASSYELPGTGEVVDNCQHVLLGCCTNLIDFYRRLGVEQQIRWYDEINFILPGGKIVHAEAGRAACAVSCDGLVPRVVGARSERQAGDRARHAGDDACAPQPTTARTFRPGWSVMDRRSRPSIASGRRCWSAR